jgi:hypothetical protein
MRRQAFHLAAAALLIATLGACSSGGYGFNTAGNGNKSIDNIVFTNGSGQVNVFAVSPTGPPPAPGAPGPMIQVNAVGTRTSQGIIVPDSTFSWTAAFTQTDAFYQTSQNGTLHPCSTAVPTSGTVLPDISPFGTSQVVFYQISGGGFAPIAPGQQSNTVFVTPAAGVGFAPGKSVYCITLTAFGNGASASVQIAVGNSL